MTERRTAHRSVPKPGSALPKVGSESPLSRPVEDRARIRSGRHGQLEVARRLLSGGMLQDLRNDVRYALRALAASPGFAAAAIVTIALGVGINTGIFTILNGVLFRDLPAARPRELVAIEQTVDLSEPTAPSGVGTVSTAEYRAYVERSRTLAGLLAHSDARETTLGGEEPRTVYGAIVSCNYFSVLETPPMLGRALLAADCEPGAPPVVVLGHELRRNAFAADDAIVGRTLELEKTAFTVVGVAAEGTYGGSPIATAYFAPLSAEPYLWPGDSRFEDSTARWLNLVGRMASGTSIGTVRAELAVVAALLDAAEPGRTTSLAVARAKPRNVPSFLRGPATGAAALLMTAFGVVLLIAAANVANLLLARGTARGREIGIRLSLGATRARIVRQLLAESALLALAGGALGSLLALSSLAALVAAAVPTALHPELPAVALALDFAPDYRVLAYALALTLGTGLVFGLAPALRASKPDLSVAIKQDGAGGSRGGGRLRGTLVGVQVASCMTLVIATGLLLRGLQATYSIDPGFAYRDVAHVSFGTDGSPAGLLDERLLEEVAALPYVTAVAYAGQTPLGEAFMGAPLRLPGESEEDARLGELDAVTPSFFEVLELPILRGRNFTAGDASSEGAAQVTRPVIVSATTAHNLFGDADPLGRTLLAGETTLEVVGVAADARLAGLGAIDPYYDYCPGAAVASCW